MRLRERDLLADFYQRWKGDQLVLDKWFTVQAVSKRQDTLEQVEQLTRHPDFSITNPNRVRSLVGAFCSANPVRFHRADGAGYRFLTDRVLELDRLNPQVASRMLRLMTRWRRYDRIPSKPDAGTVAAGAGSRFGLKGCVRNRIKKPGELSMNSGDFPSPKNRSPVSSLSI